MRYGIGITTRNRPLVLAASLQEHLKYAPKDCKFVIVDDNSELRNEEAVTAFVNSTNAEYRYSPQRLGIAKAKNACLARLLDCDHVFLFDDDAWPQFEGWADSWAWASEYEGVGHSMYMVDLSKSPKANTKEHKSQPPVEVVGNLQYFRPWDNCMGVVLHFTRQCLTALGGYDYKRAVNVYGYEHAQMSRRAMLAGFTKGYTYLSPYNANDLIYSLDISFNWYGILPAFDAPWISALSSSTTAEEAAGHPRNAAMMNVGDPHVPLVDPIGNA